jgi:succinate-semialdehyde dehydrogenase/glutarate-semialdehyde dehydrogenase
MSYTQLALYIDGRFVERSHSASAVIEPATGETIAELPHAGPAELDEAIAAAKRAFPDWAATSAYDRSTIIRRAAAFLRERAEKIGHILTMEQGKPLAEAVGEVRVSADILDWYAEEGRRAYGRIVPSRMPSLAHHVVLEPVGPAVAFTPWNFPALTPARKIGGALAAGCTLILKAAEDTPGTAVEFIRAFAEAGLPAGVLNLVFGDPAAISTHLIGSPEIRKVSFTGSTAVGKQLVRLSTEHLQRTTMELGGHAPVLVCADADPESAAVAAAASKYRNAGQVCISPTRFYVHESIIDRFTDRFVAFADALQVGNGLEPATTMGPLANSRRLEAMEAIVSDARSRGATVRRGGERKGNRGVFFEPTILTDLPDDAKVMVDEPFGPIAPIVAFRDLDEAIERANSLPYGLASYAFTQSASVAAALSSGLKSGMVGINTFAVSNPETPFGGVKESGSGSEGGIEGLQAYFDTKLVSHAV